MEEVNSQKSDTETETETESHTIIYDVLIIGGGPAGLSAAIYTSRANLNTIVLDKNPASGALGMTGKIENYPGIPERVSGEELLERFHNQAKMFGAEVVQAQVYSVDLNKDIKEVFTTDRMYRSKAIIIATGSMGRKPTIEGEAKYLGRGVSYCATCDAPFFRDRHVAVVGNIAEIVEELESIAKFAAQISIITHVKELTPEQERLLGAFGKIEPFLGHRLTKILGDEVVTGIEVQDTEDVSRTLNVAGVFFYLHGNLPIVDYLYATVETTPEGCIRVNKEDMSTNVPGVYAIGDVTCKKVRQAVLAAAEGCLAALAVEKYINKTERLQADWS